MARYEHWVDTYPIEPAIGEAYRWGAKAKVKKVGTGRTDDYVTLQEHWGKTRQEAEEKAETEARRWIAARELEGS